MAAGENPNLSSGKNANSQKTDEGKGEREKGTRRGIKTNNCCTIAAACEGVQGRGKWGIHIFDAEKYLQINCHSRQGETETDRDRGVGEIERQRLRVGTQKWLTNVVGPAASDVNLFQLRDFYIKHAGQFCIAAKLLQQHVVRVGMGTCDCAHSAYE